MSHFVSGDIYRGFTNERCYELSLRMAFGSLGPYPPGTVKGFTDEEQRQLRARLLRIIDSFRSPLREVRNSAPYPPPGFPMQQ